MLGDSVTDRLGRRRSQMNAAVCSSRNETCYWWLACSASDFIRVDLCSVRNYEYEIRSKLCMLHSSPYTGTRYQKSRIEPCRCGA